MGFNSVEKKFNGCLTEVSMLLQECFKEIFRVFQGRFRCVPRDLQG